MIKSKELSKFKHIEHAFFNKFGRKSTNLFKGFNESLGSFDKIKNISRNEGTVSNKIDAKSKKIILLNQIHSNKFYYVSKSSKLFNNKFNGDALITDKRNLPIAVLTADCAPILVHDENRKMIAAIHAGWKSLSWTFIW